MADTEVTRAIAFEASTPPEGLGDVPVYRSFYHEHESYERIHVHLIGVRPVDDEDGNPNKGFRQKRKGPMRFLKKTSIADPYVTVEAIGPSEEDLGATDYFPVHKVQYPVQKDCASPLWNAKKVLIVKKGGCTGLKFRVMDEDRGEDDVLMDFEVAKEDMPECGPPTLDGAQWKEYEISGTGGFEDAQLVFKLMVTDCAQRIASIDDVEALKGKLEYEEVILESEETGEAVDAAVLQCFRHPEGAELAGAVIWVIGRNDCFMHPHVAGRLFLDADAEGGRKAYDVYIMNYSADGATRSRGLVPNPLFNSHCRSGNFDDYVSQIEQALKVIAETRDYDTLMGYAHSTGGPVLLNYLIERGDNDFDGFVFNSPFLDWGHVGGDIVEVALESVGFLEKVHLLGMDNTPAGVSSTPEQIADTPVTYLGTEVVPSAWSSKIWSHYEFPWGSRPLYDVPVTVGFAKGVTDVHRKIEECRKKKRAITSRPFLVITSRGDDVLKASETTSRADWIGPGRCEVELHHNGHDVFLSQDVRDTELAIKTVEAWMKCYGFH